MNSQYDSIMRVYSARQAEARRLGEERMQKIYAEIPELAPLQDEITSCQAEKVRCTVEGAAGGAKDADTRLKALMRRRTELLSAFGYSAADLEIRHVCPDCQDTGFIDGEKCHCFKQLEIDLLYSQSDLKDILENENFGTFSYKWYEDGARDVMRQNVAAARLFIENFDSEFQNLLLMGGVGTGKTFLSNCIAKELMDSCHSVVYLTAAGLFDLLSQSAFSKNREPLTLAHPYIFDCDLLIIDDLGTETANSFTVSQFFLCVNERILRRKSTLISTNLDMEGLRSVYSERTLSRIIDRYTIRKLPGGDIRLKKQLASANRT